MHYNIADKILKTSEIIFLILSHFLFPYKKDLFFGGNQEIQFIVFSMLLTVCFKFNFAPVSTLQLVEVLVYAI